MRLKRGSGLDGLAAMAGRRAPGARSRLLRPLLDVPKARLVASARGRRGSPSSSIRAMRITRFERARMRGANDAFAKLGLTPEALALSARRLRRARAALDDGGATTFLSPPCRDQRCRLRGHRPGGARSLRRRKSRCGRCRACWRRSAAARTRCAWPSSRRCSPRSKAHPGQGSYARPLPHRAAWRGAARHLPRDAAGRAAGAQAPARARGRYGTIASGSRLGPPRRGPVSVRALGERGWRQLRERRGAAEGRCRGWRPGRCRPACAARRLIGLADFRQAPQGSAPCLRHEEGLDCQATFLRGADLESRGGTPQRS